MILVDTSVWIDFFRGNNSSQRKTLHSLIEDEEDISITGIILTEILQGIRKERDFETIKSYMLEFPIYGPKGIETFLESARIYRKCRRNGKTVKKTVDCIIASICIENELTILHKDRDFDHIEGCTPLKVLKT